MEFNTGGTADSSNSGAMTGGTMASSMYKNGGGVGKLNGKPFSFYKYDTKKVKIAWKGKIQPFGAFYSVEDAIEELKNHYQTQQELREYSIVTPDGIIHYGKEYPIRYAKGGGLKPIPKGNKGLPKLPESVRNKMGYMAKGGGVESEYIVTLQHADNGELLKLNVIGTSKENAVDNAYMEADLNQPYEVYSVKKMAKGGGVGKSLKEKYANLNYQIQSADSGWIKNNSEKYENMISELRKLHEKIYGKGRISKMEWGGTAESSETGEFIGGENQSSMFENGGVSTGFTYDIGGL